MRENLESLARRRVFRVRCCSSSRKKGVSREQAYEWVQRNAMRSFAEQRDFKALLLADPDVDARADRRPRSSARSISTSSSGTSTTFSTGSFDDARRRASSEV